MKCLTKWLPAAVITNIFVSFFFFMSINRLIHGNLVYYHFNLLHPIYKYTTEENLCWALNIKFNTDLANIYSNTSYLSLVLLYRTTVKFYIRRRHVINTVVVSQIIYYFTKIIVLKLQKKISTTFLEWQVGR